MSSFQDIALRMDAMTPAKSLLELDRRHRWVGPHTVSLQAMATRHLSPTTTRAKFLSYNTFLLPGVSFKYDLHAFLDAIGATVIQAIESLGLSIENFLQHIGHDAASVLEKLYNPLGLANALGLPHNTLIDAVKNVIGAADTVANVFTFGLASKVIDLNTDLTFDIVFKLAGGAQTALIKLNIGITQILDALGIDPINVLADLIVNFAAGVLTLFGVHIHFPIRLGAKPALEARAGAIGAALANASYDIMALSEVWLQTPSAETALLNAFAKSGGGMNGGAVEGPPKGDDRELDSGLLRICAGPAHIIEQKTYPFAASGEKLWDTDAWATKGVLLTRIQIGLGVIDLYSTHLISGGDLMGKIIDGIEGFLKISGTFDALFQSHVSDAALTNKRLAQIAELVTFVQQTHNPANVMIICGDTNIDAEYGDLTKTDGYTRMLEAMASMGCDDLWAAQRAFSPAYVDVLGPTHGGEDTKQARFDGGKCEVLGATGVSAENVGFCNENRTLDNAAAGVTSGRIDFVFVERPTAAHSFTLDITRLRRNPFKCEGLPDDQLYLSDHMGMDAALIASAR